MKVYKNNIFFALSLVSLTSCSLSNSDGGEEINVVAGNTCETFFITDLSGAAKKISCEITTSEARLLDKNSTEYEQKVKYVNENCGDVILQFYVNEEVCISNEDIIVYDDAYAGGAETWHNVESHGAQWYIRKPYIGVHDATLSSTYSKVKIKLPEIPTNNDKIAQYFELNQVRLTKENDFLFSDNKSLAFQRISEVGANYKEIEINCNSMVYRYVREANASGDFDDQMYSSIYKRRLESLKNIPMTDIVENSIPYFVALHMCEKS